MARAQRRCLDCGYCGEMKTWLINYNFPQFVAILGLFFFFIPGLIFIAWGWGKYKCPKCGALAKNTSDLGAATPVATASPTLIENRVEKPCQWCAEPILAAAKVCKHCGRDVTQAGV